MRRPLRVDMRFINPCSRLRGMRLGCHVRFTLLSPPLRCPVDYNGINTGCQLWRWLCCFETQEHTPKLDFIVVMQRSRSLSGKPLAIEKREICAVLIFQHVLTVLDKDAGVQTRHAALFSTMWGKVHIGENVAYRILAANHNIIFATQIKLLIIGLDNQACMQASRSYCGYLVWSRRWGRLRRRSRSGWCASRSRWCSRHTSATIGAEGLTCRIHRPTRRAWHATCCGRRRRGWCNT